PTPTPTPTPTPLPSVPVLATGSDAGVSATDGITNDATPTFVGTATPGSTVTVFAGPLRVGSAVADKDGNWQSTVGGPGSLVFRLADGRYDMTATATTVSGGPSAISSAGRVVIDTAKPVVLVSLTPPANPAGSNRAPVVATY